VDRVEILLGDAGLGLDSDRQVGVVPGVAVGVVVVEDDQRLGIGFGQPAVDAAGVGWALAVRGERSVTRSAPTMMGTYLRTSTSDTSRTVLPDSRPPLSTDFLLIRV
jgi:hypothetical protein